MANFAKDPISKVNAYKQRDLIAVFTDAQITRDKDGKPSGAYMDVQLDQSNVAKKDLAKAKIDTNPSIESHKSQIKAKDGKPATEIVSHTVWYAQSQIDAMRNVGKEVKQSTGENLIAFNADLQTVKAKDAKGVLIGGSKTIVLTPKVASATATPEQVAKISAYNKMHPFGESTNAAKINAKTLVKQDAVTAFAKTARDARVAANVAEASVGTPDVSNDMEVEA